MNIIITIPAYNEENHIGNVIKEISEVMQKTAYHHKIIVLDDGSKDNTVKIAKSLGALVYSNKRNLGLAETFKHEMRRCLENNADIIVHTDADGQYPSIYIPQLIKEIENGADLVLGSRFGKGQYSGSFMKKLGNKMFAKVFSQILNTTITDTTTGFRAFTREVAELPLINSFTYTQEQIIRANNMNMRVVEIPIKTRATRESKLFKSPLQYAARAWINILRIYRDFAPLKFFGFFGTIFFLVGFLLGIWIIYNILTTGSAGGIPRVILSGVAITTGIQIWLFGFFADMIRK
jgi:glycosyltransferase involved in cell wall biosynthesis